MAMTDMELIANLQARIAELEGARAKESVELETLRSEHRELSDQFIANAQRLGSVCDNWHNWAVEIVGKEVACKASGQDMRDEIARRLSELESLRADLATARQISRDMSASADRARGPGVAQGEARVTGAPDTERLAASLAEVERRCRAIVYELRLEPAGAERDRLSILLRRTANKLFHTAAPDYPSNTLDVVAAWLMGNEIGGRYASRESQFRSALAQAEEQLAKEAAAQPSGEGTNP